MIQACGAVRTRTPVSVPATACLLACTPHPSGAGGAGAAAAGVGAAVWAARPEGAAALPHAAAATLMPAIMAVVMIRLGLTAIGFPMSSLLAQTEVAAQIAVFRGTLSITDAGGGRFIPFPPRSNMGFDR